MRSETSVHLRLFLNTYFLLRKQKQLKSDRYSLESDKTRQKGILRPSSPPRPYSLTEHTVQSTHAHQTCRIDHKVHKSISKNRINLINNCFFKANKQAFPSQKLFHHTSQIHLHHSGADLQKNIVWISFLCSRPTPTIPTNRNTTKKKVDILLMMKDNTPTMTRIVI